MRYLLGEWDSIEERARAKTLMLFLDFDGTLAPIAPRPEAASLTKQTRGLLASLSRAPWCKLAVVSGRSLADVSQKTGLGGLVYVGNHGLEIEGPGLHYTVDIDERYFSALRQVRSALKAAIHGYRGAFIEDKGLTLSVHFRLVELDRIAALRARIRAAVTPYSRKHLVKAGSGKMVCEIRPPVSTNKGTAVRWLMDQWQPSASPAGSIALYCGDDATDEDAFRMLKNTGITIVVGAHEDSAAQYYLDSQREVDGFLERIIASGG